MAEENREIGKLVSDLDIDNDRVLLSSDLSNIIDADQVSQIVNQAIQNLDIGNAFQEMLMKNLSAEVLKIISVNNQYVIDVLDGAQDNEANIDAGGALA